MNYDYLIVGCGIFGTTFARLATDAGKRCLIIDKREHIGGSAYTENNNGINLDNAELTRGFNFELHHEGKFLHFRNACGWDNQFITNDSDKTNVLFHMISDFMEAE